MDQGKLKDIIIHLYHATGADHFFTNPLIGYPSSNDELFYQFKNIIGNYHWTPDEAIHGEYPQASAKSVIVWILPVNKQARVTNRDMIDKPSMGWAMTRSFGELANEQMRLQTAKILNEYGYPTVAPHMLQKKLGYNFKELGYSSLWSERHAAFVAGLGTFGLSAGLITKAGVAIRIGTVVTSLEVLADKREYGNDPYCWCTRCGDCNSRCPASAIGINPEDRNKQACYKHLFETIAVNRHINYGWMDYELGCGMCQSGVSCEYCIP